MLGKFWTVANMLSIARIFLVIPITYLILTDGSRAWLMGLIIFAVGTDWFDGSIARWSKTVSDWGKVLDPLADKIAAASVVLALVIRGSIPFWFLAIILVRDIAIVIGSAIAVHRLKRVLASIWWGKVAVFMLSLTVLGALLKADPPIMQALIWITSALFIYSFVLYIVRFLSLMRGKPNPEARSDDPNAGHGLSARAHRAEGRVLELKPPIIARLFFLSRTSCVQI